MWLAKKSETIHVYFKQYHKGLKKSIKDGKICMVLYMHNIIQSCAFFMWVLGIWPHDARSLIWIWVIPVVIFPWPTKQKHNVEYCYVGPSECFMVYRISRRVGWCRNRGCSKPLNCCPWLLEILYFYDGIPNYYLLIWIVPKICWGPSTRSTFTLH